MWVDVCLPQGQKTKFESCVTASVAGLLLCMGLFFDILAARSCDSAWAAKQGRFGTI
ncbi:hypothetical protein SAMN05216337_100184 [Bradyrhizobium brasilense]|uniref:Uncharacterized protein n=1 Tax=Bradyrhizobium brasilense TaxID=1419277 RepID=A0A1G6IC17_9BRAD|nr:hypothetical protein SAMN05216337_100184 [Bradyrhizobium brasilense]